MLSGELLLCDRRLTVACAVCADDAAGMQRQQHGTAVPRPGADPTKFQYIFHHVQKWYQRWLSGIKILDPPLAMTLNLTYFAYSTKVFRITRSVHLQSKCTENYLAAGFRSAVLQLTALTKPL